MGVAADRGAKPMERLKSWDDFSLSRGNVSLRVLTCPLLCSASSRPCGVVPTLSGERGEDGQHCASFPSIHHSLQEREHIAARSHRAISVQIHFHESITQFFIILWIGFITIVSVIGLRFTKGHLDGQRGPEGEGTT